MQHGANAGATDRASYGQVMIDTKHAVAPGSRLPNFLEGIIVRPVDRDAVPDDR